MVRLSCQGDLGDEEVWYPANEYAGKRLFWVGIGTVVSALAMFLLPISNVGVYASVVGGSSWLDWW